MGNRASARESDTREIVINDAVTISRRTRTRFVVIIAMCCSTVINKVEPEHRENNNEADYSNNEDKNNTETVTPPKKPLNSRPRVRRYGYRFTAKVDPLVLSPADLEELSTIGKKINSQSYNETEQLDSKVLADVDEDDESEDEFVEIPWEEEIKRLMAIREAEQKEKDLARSRARSAVMLNVKKNEFHRRKMNEIRHMQAKMKREEEKAKLADMKKG